MNLGKQVVCIVQVRRGILLFDRKEAETSAG